MNIIQIIPGSGGSFYCGNCLRDSKFYDALRKQNHSILKVPMYLPLFADEHDLNSETPVFYGAISIYLKQLYPVFRHAPRWLDGLLNSKPMLKLAASKAGSTNAKGLEEMTLSMLLGEQGKQADELNHMVNWIAEHCNPDVIHLSNALLLGLAPKLKQKLNCKIVCSLQDEDVWVDIMTEKYRAEIWKLMGNQAQFVDLFVSVSDFYTGVSINRMNLDQNKIKTVHLGVDPQDYRTTEPNKTQRAVGFISRMNEANGLDVFIDAFIELKKNSEFSDVIAYVTGGSTGDDKEFIHQIKRKLKLHKLESQVTFLHQFEGEHRMEFFDKISLLSVPVKIGEAFGIYLTEAMACGIPIVQPALGAFPEIIKKGGGGLVYEPNTPSELASAWQKVLSDKTLLSRLSKEARTSVEQNFNINQLAEQLINIYQTL